MGLKEKLTGNLDLSGGKTADKQEEQARNDIKDIDAKDMKMNELKQKVAREVGHIARTAYNEGKSEGKRQAENNDKHYKATLIAMFSAAGTLIFLVAQSQGFI